MSVYYNMNSTVRRGKRTFQRGNKRQVEMRVNYSKALLNRNVQLPIVNIGADLSTTLERKIASSIEGKCIAEGFVKPDTTKVMSYSSGTIQGGVVCFEVCFECKVCYPVQGMKISCVAKNITKAGIRADTSEDPDPLVIFVARDHHNKMPYFSQVNEGDKIEVKVIGQRFELNDKYISIIAELVEPGKETPTKMKREKIVIEDSPPLITSTLEPEDEDMWDNQGD